MQSKAIKVNNGGDKGAVRKALTSWVGCARGTFIRYVMDQDEPDKLGKVALTVSEDGLNEADIGEDDNAGGEVKTFLTAAPLITGSSIQVGVVAKAPALKKGASRKKS